MTYLYLSEIENNYLIISFAENYDFTDPLNKGGLICKLELTDEEVLSKYGISYGGVADQAIELKILLAGCKLFKQEEINLRVNQSLTNYMQAIDPVEKETFDIELKEAENYINSKENYFSNILKSLALAKSLKVDEVVQTIIEKAKNHQANLISFKCRKDYLIGKLEYIDTLTDFKNFNVETEIENYLKDFYFKKEPPRKDDEFLLISNDEINKTELLILAKNNKKKSAKDQLLKKPQEILIEDRPREIKNN